MGEVTTAIIATIPATQLQPPFGQSVNSLCHPWFTTTNVSYRFPILKLPPPPCAVLLVLYINHHTTMNLGSRNNPRFSIIPVARCWFPTSSKVEIHGFAVGGPQISWTVLDLWWIYPASREMDQNRLPSSKLPWNLSDRGWKMGFHSKCVFFQVLYIYIYDHIYIYMCVCVCVC